MPEHKHITAQEHGRQHHRTRVNAFSVQQLFLQNTIDQSPSARLLEMFNILSPQPKAATSWYSELFVALLCPISPRFDSSLTSLEPRAALRINGRSSRLATRDSPSLFPHWVFVFATLSPSIAVDSNCDSFCFSLPTVWSTDLGPPVDPALEPRYSCIWTLLSNISILRYCWYCWYCYCVVAHVAAPVKVKPSPTTTTITTTTTTRADPFLLFILAPAGHPPLFDLVRFSAGTLH
ncbi:hypothetical protein FPOAC1_004728 [Fusarium poae]|uniref:hypothetical protein n=1 Tax=Fusarium poae TaxID=36050 RepID=UPI001CE8D4C4|nr:hypothetical protein FPOAC1_004728 [Fusarium poae]KAG8671480.1 hypothetical protein FPOAC1_004728 [Fusarium poae]